MYIRKTHKTVKGKTYTNHILVESVRTPKGPRQKTICSLGNLNPRPAKEWLALAHKIEDSLIGQMRFDEDDPEVEAIVEKIQARQKLQKENNKGKTVPDKGKKEKDEVEEAEIVSVVVDKVTTEKIRKAGAVNVGLHYYNLLDMDEILKGCGFTERTLTLTKVMIMNRLIAPKSEHAMPDWVRTTALPDILGSNLEELSDDALYRHLDRIHPHREQIESELAQREKRLFNLDDTIYLYDLTSTYFEGECKNNPKAQRGHSRDGRPDCKQVVVGLVVDRDGFPKAHEVFDGNRNDKTTVNDMLDALEKRVGKKEDALVVVDRGMAYDDNLKDIKKHGYDYLVASRQGERNKLLEEFECLEGWKEVRRETSPENPYQKKSGIRIRRLERGDETLVLCWSDERVLKDRSIREKQEKRFLQDIEKLSSNIVRGGIKDPKKINQRIGRLKERYSRVARYYKIEYDEESKKFSCSEDIERKSNAERLDGTYILKTNRKNMEGEEIWRIYSLLTRAENAFRCMKSPLACRPIFHQLPHRVETHIFLCILAYHLLVSIERTMLDQGIHTSWAAIREALDTHNVVTVVLPADNGDVLRIRKPSKPDAQAQVLYKQLTASSNFMKPKKRWHRKLKNSD